MRSIPSLYCLVLLAAANACGNSTSDQGSATATGGSPNTETAFSESDDASNSRKPAGGGSPSSATKRSSTGGASSKSSAAAEGGTKASDPASSSDDSKSTGGSSESSTTKTNTGGTKAAGGSSTATSGKASGGSSGTSNSKSVGGSAQGGSSSKPNSNDSQSGGATANTTSAPSGGQTSSSTSGSGGSLSPSEECTDSSTDSGTFTTRYDAGKIKVTGKQKSYVIHTNWWYKYTSQTVSYNGLSMKIGDSQKTAVSASEGAPTGFPSIFIGSYTGNTSEGSNLPKQVSALKSVPTILSTDASAHDTSNYNATYDVWFTAASSPLPEAASDPGGDGALLMVWLYKPSARQPRGGKCSASSCTPDQPNHTVAGVSQSTWDVWLGPGGGGRAPCVSYVSTKPLDSLSFDLNKFIQDAVANNYFVKSSMYLSIVFGGLEIWGGGDGVQIKQYCAQVN